MTPHAAAIAPALPLDSAALAAASVAEAEPDAEDCACPPPWPALSLAKTKLFAASREALMPVPFVHEDGCEGDVEVKVISAH